MDIAFIFCTVDDAFKISQSFSTISFDYIALDSDDATAGLYTFNS